MSKLNLFGDAKATARAADSGRKQTNLAAAQEAYRDNANKATQHALATALFDLGRFEDAAKLLTDLLVQFGEDRQALYDLAFTYKNMDRLEDAKSAFLRVVAMDPKHSLARSAENEMWMIDPTYKPSWMRGK